MFIAPPPQIPPREPPIAARVENVTRVEDPDEKKKNKGN